MKILKRILAVATLILCNFAYKLCCFYGKTTTKFGGNL